MWAYSAKIAKISIFWSKFVQKGYSPLTDFYKIWCNGGSPRSAPSHQISPFWLKQCGPTAAKIAKNRNFLYKFAPMENFWKSTEKVEYRCTTTNLPACKDTIIVLIVILLHSVSVIINFVIPKRDKQTKNITFSPTAGARPTIPTILAMVIEEDRTIFAPPNFF